MAGRPSSHAGRAPPIRSRSRGVPREEVELMAHRQGQRITRALHDQLLQHLPGPPQITPEPGLRRGHVHPLPPGQRRTVQPGVEVREAPARLVGVPRLGPQHPRYAANAWASGARGHAATASATAAGNSGRKNSSPSTARSRCPPLRRCTRTGGCRTGRSPWQLHLRRVSRVLGLRSSTRDGTDHPATPIKVDRHSPRSTEHPRHTPHHHCAPRVGSPEGVLSATRKACSQLLPRKSGRQDVNVRPLTPGARVTCIVGAQQALPGRVLGVDRPAVRRQSALTGCVRFAPVAGSNTCALAMSTRSSTVRPHGHAWRRRGGPRSGRLSAPVSRRPGVRGQLLQLGGRRGPALRA